MKSILDPSFEYVPAVETDIRVRFAAVKKANAEAKAAREAEAAAAKARAFPEPMRVVRKVRA